MSIMKIFGLIFLSGPPCGPPQVGTQPAIALPSRVLLSSTEAIETRMPAELYVQLEGESW